MTKLKALRRRLLSDPEVRTGYEELASEFDLARILIAARTRAGLTQSQVAERMNTTQSAIARLESGRLRPSSRTIERYAAATGTRVQIQLVPRGEDDDRRDAATRVSKSAKTGEVVSGKPGRGATAVRKSRRSTGSGPAAAKKAG